MISSEIRRDQYKNASQRWRARHPDRHEATKRKSAAISKGLDPEEVKEYFDNHNGLCDICGCPPSRGNKNLCLEHDHETGEFRGLVCSECNTGMGMFKDNLDLLEKAIDFLLNPPARIGEEL
jgi:hypothetical protein